LRSGSHRIPRGEAPRDPTLNIIFSPSGSQCGGTFLRTGPLARRYSDPLCRAAVPPEGLDRTA